MSTEEEAKEEVVEVEVESDTDILLDLARRDDVNERLPLAFCKQILLQSVESKCKGQVARILEHSLPPSTENMTTAFRRFEDEEILLSKKEKACLVSPSGNLDAPVYTPQLAVHESV
jgi:hypothetical protein